MTMISNLLLFAGWLVLGAVLTYLALIIHMLICLRLAAMKRDEYESHYESICDWQRHQREVEYERQAQMRANAEWLAKRRNRPARKWWQVWRMVA